jgi:UDP-N-acetylmuramate--alanine ligase
LYQYLKQPLSYSVGAKLSFSPMGAYTKDSTYFAYECDEFDKNFLHFNPKISIISSVDWDHQEIYPTREEYKQAFRQFISQSAQTILFRKDAEYLIVTDEPLIIEEDDALIPLITLTGLHNRRNARLAIEAVHTATNTPKETLITAINTFPGSSRRFEQIAPQIYTDYAHTPEEIAATLQLAHELSDNIVVIYEPLTDRRQHFMKDGYTNLFTSAKKVYWLPSYLAREDPHTTVLTPDDLISGLNKATNAVVAQKDDVLIKSISQHVDEGAIIICMAGGGGGSLDEWARQSLIKTGQ